MWLCESVGSRLPAPTLWPVLDIQPAPGPKDSAQPSLPSITEETGPKAGHASSQPNSQGNDNGIHPRPEEARAKALNAAAASALLLQLGRHRHRAPSHSPEQDSSSTMRADSARSGGHGAWQQLA